MNEKGLAFFLSEGFEATVCQIPHPEIHLTIPVPFSVQDRVLQPNGKNRSGSAPVSRPAVRLHWPAGEDVWG